MPAAAVSVDCATPDQNARAKKRSHMNGGLRSRLSSAGLLAGVVVALLLAGSSGVAAAAKVLAGGCTYYEPGEAGGPTKCPGWQATNTDLSGLNFTGADLSKGLLVNVNLRGTTFTKADLRGLKAMSAVKTVTSQTKWIVP